MQIDIGLSGIRDDNKRERIADRIEDLMIEWSMEGDEPPEDFEEQIQEIIDEELFEAY